jgi:hypothetical protein
VPLLRSRSSGRYAPTVEGEIRYTAGRLEELDTIRRPVLEQRRKLEKKEIAALRQWCRRGRIALRGSLVTSREMGWRADASV